MSLGGHNSTLNRWCHRRPGDKDLSETGLFAGMGNTAWGVGSETGR